MPRAETKVWTIIVGGGSGQRFGSPKQYELLDDRRVIDHARDTAESACAGVVLVVPEADVEREGGVAGGETRSASVRAGLAAVPDDADIICVHDAARPLASAALYARVIDAVLAGLDAAIPGIPVTDTIKVIHPGVSSQSGDSARIRRDETPEADETPGWGVVESAHVLGEVADTPERSTLVAVQTPQAFRADQLRAAHAAGGDATDDAALIERAGGCVVVVEGEQTNRKITTPDDLAWTRARLAERSS